MQYQWAMRINTNMAAPFESSVKHLFSFNSIFFSIKPMCCTNDTPMPYLITICFNLAIIHHIYAGRG